MIKGQELTVEVMEYARPALARQRSVPHDHHVLMAIRLVPAAIVLMPFVEGIILICTLLAAGDGGVIKWLQDWIEIG